MSFPNWCPMQPSLPLPFVDEQIHLYLGIFEPLRFEASQEWPSHPVLRITVLTGMYLVC